VRTQRYKYIRRFGDWTKPVLPNCDDGLSKSVWLEYGWGRQEIPREDLYDLIFDPDENHNLAKEPGSATVLAEMRGRLDAWMKRTDDPLLRGQVPLPAGARVNPQDGVSPKDKPDTRI
jgi:N-sulfoglucosamine sulfohydrolase